MILLTRSWRLIRVSINSENNNIYMNNNMKMNNKQFKQPHYSIKIISSITILKIVKNSHSKSTHQLIISTFNYLYLKLSLLKILKNQKFNSFIHSTLISVKYLKLLPKSIHSLLMKTSKILSSNRLMALMCMLLSGKGRRGMIIFTMMNRISSDQTSTTLQITTSTFLQIIVPSHNPTIFSKEAPFLKIFLREATNQEDTSKIKTQLLKSFYRMIKLQMYWLINVSFNKVKIMK